MDSEKYLFTVLRYIHQNPNKVGLCNQVENYAYSSYSEYINVSDLVDTAYIFEYITLEEFVDLNHEKVDTACMDISEKTMTRVTDEQAIELIRKISKCKNVSDFQSLDVSTDKYLKKLRDKGISI